MQERPSPSLLWSDDTTPVAEAFDDPYFAFGDGAAESSHVFLDGNGLPDRARAGFSIAELGFGTGLNLIVAARACAGVCATSGGRMRFTSFEAFPMRSPDMARALSRWPDLGPWAEPLVEHIEQGREVFPLGPFDVRLVIGDARDTLPAWPGKADAWFLDGFSPARNPELWGEALMQAVADHTTPGGTFATYTAAGHVRRALATAGFEVQRTPGFGRKRHMSRGQLSGV
ncbi:tRNA (5-methylaminomethyl-2-thiouridine)(34)-methyltransferase MnmD [Oceanibium sediminis]|uniref:tRNA (5-methylaminomethyl-2-thiouridine)(34)-methyltransferase MnmD n=1 Tax=Oceanibium sediminis TaxID=2026339 RepID=UPI000DD3C138|nr:tRNA (5-methylaminomethyl-2-thiouridine)(34)-methyltransferase MnmD [Oceanibium sediminis]